MAFKAKKLLLKAKGLARRGMIDQARQIYNQILEVYPNNVEAKRSVEYLNSTTLSKKVLPVQSYLLELKKMLEKGRFQDVVARSKTLPPELNNDPLALNIIAAAFKAIGDLDEAILRYKMAIEINPNFAEAYNNLGTTLMSRGELSSAEDYLKIALEKRPDYSLAHNNLGLVLADSGKEKEALDCYLAAIEFSPNFSSAHDNLGNLYSRLGHHKKAINHYEEAIRKDSRNASALNNLGTLLKELGRSEEARRHYENAISVLPDFAEGYNNLGTLSLSEGKFKQATENFRKAIIIKPQYFDAYSNLIFSIASEAKTSAEDVLNEAADFSEICSEKSLDKYVNWNCDCESSVLKVGFVSGDIRNHPVGYFLEGILDDMSKGPFEFFGYSTTFYEDELTIRAKPFFKEWKVIAAFDWGTAAEKIYQDNLHILIDLAGHTAANGLPIFSYKPAPVQCSWLGYFGTTGVREMDFLLGDPYVTPEEEEHHFSEKIWRLPETYLCFTEPAYEIDIGPLPALENGYITFGCFNNLTKITDEVIWTWVSILREMNTAKLFLKCKQFDSLDLRQQTIERFSLHDIQTDRLILEGSSPRHEYLNRYNEVDILLDPFPYPGGTTSAEALWMGVPSIVMAGDRFLSHLGESVAHNTDQSTWIANDKEEYIFKAIEFSKDIGSLVLLRQNLRKQAMQSPLFNRERFVKHLSDALRGMWRSYNVQL